MTLFFVVTGLRKPYTDDTSQTLAVARTLKLCKQIGMFDSELFLANPSK